MQVWTIADSRQTSFLLLKDFYVAMRLIALAQQGHPVNLPHFYELASSPFALARLEGVPPPQQQQQQPPASTYAITSDEKTKYQGIFAQYDTDHDGFLLGQDAAALFQMSGMDRNDLRTVWTLADRSSDGRLDLTEFYIAMHLIVCVTKRGLPLPQTLPLELEQSLRSTGSFSQPASGHLQPTQPPQPPAPVQGMSAFDDLDGGSPAAAESSSIGFGNMLVLKLQAALEALAHLHPPRTLTPHLQLPLLLILAAGLVKLALELNRQCLHLRPSTILGNTKLLAPTALACPQLPKVPLRC
ncbi:hypothetical protein DYB30_013236 [Aphanomyces astaci]|uniref:Uncharacterized protein n=1 Tax=Aphanomyces astaci TaxID=112090 RepID=A0A397E4D8_APHAT|nr:hypothetical protein DYB30_013236 [Aphanomyces astaci]